MERSFSLAQKLSPCTISRLKEKISWIFNSLMHLFFYIILISWAIPQLNINSEKTRYKCLLCSWVLKSLNKIEKIFNTQSQRGKPPRTKTPSAFTSSKSKVKKEQMWSHYFPSRARFLPQQCLLHQIIKHRISL